jgi:PqqD family protein of HPr-rel-A system
MTMRWKIIDDGALEFRSWEDECVVYNTLSGDVCLCEREAVDILRMLQRSPADTRSLAGMLADSWQCDVSETLLRTIDGALAAMHAQSLIERVRP